MKEQDLLDAIHRAQAQYIARTEASVLFDEMLSSLLSITQSEYGFIGEIKLSDEGERYLKTHALTNIAWNKETREFYEQNAPFGLEFRNLDTLFGHVIRTGEVVIANSPQNDSRASGIPPGHPALNHFLGIPFYLSETLIGMAGIANKEGGYTDDDVNFLKPLVSTCAQLVDAYRIERERKEMLESLQAMKEQADSANKAKSEFLANVNHEMRTPLHGIKGTVELIQEYAEFNNLLDDNLKTFINNVLKSCNHLSEIINDTLDIAKVEAGTINLDISKFNVNTLLEEVSTLLSDYASDNRNNLALRECTEQIFVESDKQKVKQIVINLVSNALKFTSDGQVNISFGSVNSPKGPCVKITVSDNGIGISQEDLEHIFAPFVQVNSSATKKYKGTGLGLNICMKFAEMLNGELTVTSTLGEGSSFSLTLPIRG